MQEFLREAVLVRLQAASLGGGELFLAECLDLVDGVAGSGSEGR